jgi:hypothetical protein
LTDEESDVNVTRAAADVIELVREEHGIPEEFGVRLFPSRNRPDEQGVAIDFAESPCAGDEISRQFGTLVYVARDVADDLADVNLDAIPVASDDGQSLRLVLRSGTRAGRDS